MNYKVVEKFVSINGEGCEAGTLATFIRFAGCNLNCSYCDTQWANKVDVPFEWLDEKEIYHYIKELAIRNVTLTGGEPLLQEGIEILLKTLSDDPAFRVEIETNGSIDLKKFTHYPVIFTMDYKLKSSLMEDSMLTDNFKYLNAKDTVKFVVGTIEDLVRAYEIIQAYTLLDRSNVHLSALYGSIEMSEIVDFMKKNNMNGVKFQPQLHKFIWHPNERGV